MQNILTILIFFPALAALVGTMLNEKTIRTFVIFATLVEFAFAVLLWINFDTNETMYQFTQMYPILTAYGINYIVGVDGISLFLVVMTTFMTLISVIALSPTKNMKSLLITVLFLEMTMVGVFVALDAIVFYIFWELSLVPMLYIIGAWGGERRVYASVKFFIYTFAGSLIMLIGMLYLGYVYYALTGNWSFSFEDWNLLLLPFDMQVWLFVAFFFGFAIKVPMIPFHTWLPYAHGQAPTIGSVLLAAVLLKMGTYGFIRISLPFFPDASVYLMIPMAILAIIAIIYTAMLALAQEDIKQVIAYSSISHMGVIILGIFAFNVEGIGGAIFLMISHGLVSGALFILVGVLYDRRKTKLAVEFGGLAKVMPKYATIFAIVLMASIGLPLTIGFVGEFLALIGFFKANPYLTVIAGLTIILGAVYMLVLYKKIFFGSITNEKNRELKDIKGRETLALVPICALVFALGIYPIPLLEPIDTSVKHTIELMEIKAQKDSTKEKLIELNLVKDFGKVEK